MDKDRRTEQKTWQVYNFGKRNVFRLDLNESRKGFCRRERERSFHVDGPKTEKVREPTFIREVTSCNEIESETGNNIDLGSPLMN